jgi:hypothetical protein
MWLVRKIDLGGERHELVAGCCINNYDQYVSTLDWWPFHQWEGVLFREGSSHK